MQMSGEYKINAPREKVWAGLNDPDVLKLSIPGCEQIEQTSETSFEAQVTAKVGPVKAKLNGAVELTDIDAPNGYRISGEGKGGAAGFAKGGANIKLEEDGDGTLLKYEVDAQVGGKLAQLGARLIDGTAKKMASQFFENFAEAVTNNDSIDRPDEETSDTGSTAPPPSSENTAPTGKAIPKVDAKILALVLIVAAVALYALFG
ncbi:MAG TPA: carbon monoxide dehydrogenase [Rhodospirillaceae bacterium]|nr:carbon monoxide dehydrogenase [Rhodospirillaceae bacterium]